MHYDQFSWPYFTVWPAKFISLLEFKYSPSILTERYNKYLIKLSHFKGLCNKLCNLLRSILIYGQCISYLGYKSRGGNLVCNLKFGPQTQLIGGIQTKIRLHLKNQAYDPADHPANSYPPFHSKSTLGFVSPLRWYACLPDHPIPSFYTHTYKDTHLNKPP